MLNNQRQPISKSLPEARNTFFFERACTLAHISIASAADVDSPRRAQLATGRAVMSAIYSRIQNDMSR